jgi:hypothetical protein
MVLSPAVYRGIANVSSAKIKYCLIAAYMLTRLVCVAQEFDLDHRAVFLSFRVPDSTATYPLSINDAMTTTGYYVSKSGVTSGFVRDRDGIITTFGVPGSVLTKPVSINTAGDVAGYYEVASSTDSIPDVPQGFIRAADGTITTFGNTTTGFTSFWAQPVAINVAGEVVGNYPDFNLASNVFVRSVSGTVSTFTLSFGADFPTTVTGLNAGGAVIGYASSSTQLVAQGFLWSGSGSVPNPLANSTTLITASGSTGTFPTGINADGTIVGCYSIGTIYYDFVRDTDGTITTLSVPGTVPGCVVSSPSPGLYDVVPPSITINDEGTIAGSYTDAAKVPSGFVQSADGKLTTFAHPGATLTMPTSINNRGEITGYYSKGPETRGFIRLPRDREHIY